MQNKDERPSQSEMIVYGFGAIVFAALPGSIHNQTQIYHCCIVSYSSIFQTTPRHTNLFQPQYPTPPQSPTQTGCYQNIPGVLLRLTLALVYPSTFTPPPPPPCLSLFLRSTQVEKHFIC